jgi:hypothetical protein
MRMKDRKRAAMTRNNGATTTTARDGDGAFKTCDRCGGRFPGPGISRKGRIYCCDKCAAVPGVDERIRMSSAAATLIVFGIALGWSAARSQR